MLVTTVGVIYRKNILETDMAMLFLLLNIVSASLLSPRNAYLMTIMGVIVYYYFLLPD
ncbi:sensor histidine kinase, partial [Vibrio anguillarum]|nr:sensor histidine kinase [Vibrio anguillarum]